MAEHGGFADGRWVMAVGHDGGKPVVYKVRDDCPTGIAPADYRHLVALFWTYHPDPATGQPADPDADRMDEFEGLLLAALQPARQAVLTAVVTGTGVREWQWYSRDPDETLRLMDAAIAGRGPYPVEAATADEPAWESHARGVEIVDRIGREAADVPAG